MPLALRFLVETPDGPGYQKITSISFPFPLKKKRKKKAIHTACWSKKSQDQAVS